MRSILAFLLTFCLIIIPFQNIQADTLPVFFPLDNSTAAPRNIGTKANIIFVDSDTFIPLDTDISNAEVTVSFSGTSASCPTMGDNTCRGTIEPRAENVTFDHVSSDVPNDGIEETLRIIYGSFFPPATDVQIEISNLIVNGEPFNVVEPWNFTTSSNPPRDPASLVFVLDRSGSMNSSANPAEPGAPSKINALRQAVGTFLDTIPPFTLPNDRISVVFFNQDVIEPLSTELLDSTLETSLNTIRSHVNNMDTVEGRTSVGDGLIRAESLLGLDDNPRKEVLLFTDGRQNEEQLVREEKASFPDEMDPEIIIGPPNAPLETNIGICVISIGVDGDAARKTFNDRIARKRCEDLGEDIKIDALEITTLDSLSDPTLVEDFLTILEKTVVGDKLEKIKVLRDSVNLGEIKTEQFTLSKQDIRLSLVLTWSNPNIRSLDVLLRSPDGTEIDPGPFTRTGEQYSVISFSLPAVINSPACFSGGSVGTGC